MFHPSPRMTDHVERHWTRHPVVVLMMGTLITSLLIPAFQSRGLKKRQEEEARSRFIQGLYQFDSEVNRSLNSLATTFEFAVKVDDEPEALKEFQRMALEHYSSFDQIAWWRLDALCSEFIGAVDLKEAPATAMWAEVAGYEKVLGQRSEMLGKAWPVVYGKPSSDDEINLEWFQQELRPTQLELSAQGQKHLVELMRLAKP